jgi:hypothetical protein
VQRSTGSWPLRPVRTDYRTALNPYEWRSDEAPGFVDISAMQPFDMVMLALAGATGYSVVWLVRHERAVRRLRSRPRL